MDKVKKLTKSQLKKIAKMHAAAIIMATEPTWAFESSYLSRSELEYLTEAFEKISSDLLNGETPLFDSKQIVDYVRKNSK